MPELVEAFRKAGSLMPSVNPAVGHVPAGDLKCSVVEIPVAGVRLIDNVAQYLTSLLYLRMICADWYVLFSYPSLLLISTARYVWDHLFDFTSIFHQSIIINCVI